MISATFLIVTLVPAVSKERPARMVARWLLALFYVAAGILHLTSPVVFLRIMPGFIPYPEAVVLATGLCEIAGGIGLLLAPCRRAAGLLLALYAVCVFPANIGHAMLAAQGAAWPETWWYHAPRLGLQPVLVWWALWVGGWSGMPTAEQDAAKKAGKRILTH